jgi:suppressor for copper-sensitivity B
VGKKAKMKFFKSCVALIILMFASLGQHAYAETPVRVKLLNGGYVNNQGTAVLGLEIRLDDGWHTYWKSPGDGGVATEFDTSKSENLNKFEVKWPTPHRIYLNSNTGQTPFEVNGYERKVVLPILVTPQVADKPIVINLSTRVYACKDICSAFSDEFEVTISSLMSAPQVQREIAYWLRKLPRENETSLTLTTPKKSQSGAITVGLASFGALDEPWVHIHTQNGTLYTVERISQNSQYADFKITPQKGERLDIGDIQVVGTSGPLAVELSHSFSQLVNVDYSILITAILGGLILNLMPCVFPVLSLKLMALVQDNERKVRIGFAGSALGIVLSFTTLASILAVLKSLGMQVGWGIQFQNPVFMAGMALVVFVFAFWTLGAFELSLPSKTATTLAKKTDGTSFFASVGQGFVATLLATPCSAPFVGTAVGFALGGSTIDMFAIFSGMAFGMALPYLALAAAPGVSRLMPKPGRWMNTIKTMMALTLFATSGWLASSVTGVSFVILMATMPVAGVYFAIMFMRPSRSVIIPALALLAFVAPIATAQMQFANEDGILWRSFAPMRISDYISDGKIVIVNMTADWCITCKVNDRTTWNDGAVIAAMEGVVAMEGDWTRPDPRISDYLKTFGRYGIPLTVVYTQKSPNGILLPELLTPNTILDEISQQSE